MNHSTQPFILTLTLEDALAETLNALRRAYFPPERNYLDAHVTLFHALPDDKEGTLRRDLREICTQTPPFEVVLPELKGWGKGVFVRLESPDLLSVRKSLAARWQDDLTPQDRQGYRPHVTIQNKVSERGSQSSLRRPLPRMATAYRALARPKLVAVTQVAPGRLPRRLGL